MLYFKHWLLKSKQKKNIYTIPHLFKISVFTKDFKNHKMYFKFEDLSWCLSWFALGLLVHFSSWFFHLGKCLRHEHCLDYRRSSFFKTRSFKKAGSPWYLKREWMFMKRQKEKNNCKVNFFSVYFVWNNQELHLSFKNSEK